MEEVEAQDWLAEVIRMRTKPQSLCRCPGRRSPEAQKRYWRQRLAIWQDAIRAWQQ